MTEGGRLVLARSSTWVVPSHLGRKLAEFIAGASPGLPFPPSGMTCEETGVKMNVSPSDAEPVVRSVEAALTEFKVICCVDM